jgi:cytidylate kinase
VIALDGPAASGKSAAGAAAAAALAFRFFDTGAMYRAITWLALNRGIDVRDADALVTLAEGTQITVNDRSHADGATGVLLDGEDATAHLRDDDVERNVSLVSRVPGVRRALVRIQRELARDGSVVMAGRDIGTVVLPDADLKVYLDASRDVRARRRAEQIERAGGRPPDFAALVAELERRDGIDSTREASPLTAATDAVIINTDELTIEEVVRRILRLAA